MRPDAGGLVEVGSPQPSPVGIARQADRHGGHRGGHHELAGYAHHASSGVVERGDVDPEHADRDLAGPNRAEGCGTHEGGADVGAAGGRGEQHSGGDVLVDDVPADLLVVLGPHLRRAQLDGRLRAVRPPQVQSTFQGPAEIAAWHLGLRP
jgi:hypothetical protein